MYSEMNGTTYLSGGDSTYFWGFYYYDDESLQPLSFPSPELIFTEGDSVKIHLLNLSGEGHTIHLHGLDVDQSNDGVPATSYYVQPGDTGTYFFVAQHPGNYIYHCHVTSTLHVTMGMYGSLIIKSKTKNLLYSNGPTYDKEYTYLCSEIDKSWNDNYMNMGAFYNYTPDRFLINGMEKSQLFQDTSQVITASAGDTVLLRLLNIGFNIAEFNFPSSLDATAYTSDGRPLPSPEKTNKLKIYPGERYSVMLHFNSSYSGYIRTRSLHMYNEDEIEFNEIGINTYLPSGKVKSGKKYGGARFCYPNPANNYLLIDHNPKSSWNQLTIYSITGKVVAQFPLNSQTNSISIARIKPGIYLAEVRDSNQNRKQQKVIIE